jgi:hypothetical protein
MVYIVVSKQKIKLEVMIMPLFAISRGEPVTAPTVINTYNKDEENSPFFHNFTGKPKQIHNTSIKFPYNTQNQIVFMETSVHDYLGHNLNIYV